LNPTWLKRNLATSWSHRAGVADFLRCLIVLYSARLPRALRKPEWTIGFRYPPPIGNVRLLLRDNAGSDLFIHSEVFEHEYYRLPLVTPPRTILDLGANVGLTVVYFSRLFPGALLACVEPVAENLRVLARNLELNGVVATVIAAAVDVRDGPVMMELQERDYGHKVLDAPFHSSQPILEVPGISVPGILQHLAWDRIGLLKVDIEGHEARLFSRDCDWLDRVDSLCIECHEGFGETDLRNLANRFGFHPPRALPGIWLMSREPPG
jgi:FkbM family methyltransferase